MKYRIRNLFALTLALSMLLSMIPFGMAAESLDEFEDYETLEEIPFEFELEPGDLPFEQLKDATLAAEDIPYCINPALAEARGHVNRLYLQEPNDYTVMFQNKDGSKTVYVFSHPVKGMTMTTTASIQVNGSVISFSGTNAITSRLSELSDYNIGYSEVAYIPNGVLSADGINLTEDARGWARGESMPSSLAYNISGEAAAEYAASVTVPDADVFLAAVTPGVTITPNDPAPLGGMTVMSISYSDLAGLMSLKNMATNQFLRMTSLTSPSLSTSSSISTPYSRWFVQFDSMRGYVLSNINNVFNTYLGRMSGQSVLTIGPKSSIDYVFGLTIVSTYDSTVTIGFNDYAIDSTLSIYQRNPDDDTFPTACEWKIYNKQDITLASSISCSATRTEECGSGFYLDYTVYPTNASYYEIGLYYASTGQSVEHDTEVYEGDEYEYFVNTPGTYTVYYKDSVTGIQSQNFTLTIVTDIAEINLPSDTRIEQKGVGFSPLYILEPSAYLSPYDIRLYYASDNIEVSKNSAGKYVINTAGLYTVYYKDSVSGVTSVEFTMIIIETSGAGQPVNFPSNHTYAIQPYGYGNLFLTMTDNDGIGTTQNSFSVESLITEWDDQSQTFVFDTAEGDSYSRTIFATLSTDQYQAPSYSVNSITSTYTGNYFLPDEANINNALYYSSSSNAPVEKKKSDTGSIVQVYDIGGYYVIGFDFGGQLMALKYDTEADPALSIEVYDPTKTEFRWNISYVGVDTELIKQTHATGCGATTTLMFMYGMGLDDSIEELNQGINLTLQQSALRTALNYNIDYYITIGSIKNYINSIYENLKSNPVSNYGYWYEQNKSEITTTLLSNNITAQNVMIARVNTSTVDYYQLHNKNIIHYWVITGKLNINGITYYVVLDCHYNNNYFGIHIINESKLLGATTHVFASVET